jgi:uncharacterized membrane protein YkoI
MGNMARDRSSTVALAAVLALAPSRALPQTAPPQPNPGGTEQAQSSLVQAIRVAEQQTGGRARKAEMEREQGVDAFEIKTVARDTSATVIVDMASGKVLRIEGPGFLGSLFEREDQREDQADLARLEASPMKLVDAIAAAESETGGRAVTASMKSQYGQTLFEVGVVKDLIPNKVMVDPASGKVVAVPRRHDRED